MRPFLFLILFAALIASCREEKPTPANTPTGDTLSYRSNKRTNPYSNLDQSQMDMIYYPADFPALKMNGRASQPVMRIIYGRPHANGRQVFGSTKSALVTYGHPWRLGANEATEMDLFTDVKINGQTLPKGVYVMYCIPQKDNWTIVFNSNTYSWGLHTDSTKDVMRTTAMVQPQEPAVEDFTMVFRTDANDQPVLLMAWDSVKVELPVTVAK